MENANGREEGDNEEEDEEHKKSDFPIRPPHVSTTSVGVVESSNSMTNSPPPSPGRSRSPLLFTPQAPVAPIQRGIAPLFSQMWSDESQNAPDAAPEQGIPTMITWSYGGSNVAVEGSWDNWTSRKIMQRTGKDHSILLVLPSGICQHKFLVDGEWRYIPDLPFLSDETGHTHNIFLMYM